MKASTSSYVSTIAGFATALLAAAAMFATLGMVAFRPGGEFNSRWEVAAFHLFVWGVVMLACSGIGFAAALAPMLRYARPVRLPVVWGFLGGTAVVALGAFGQLGALQRQLALPWPLLWLVTGLAIGMCVAVLALAASVVLTNRARA